MNILAGDIGGTKTILQLLQYTDRTFSILAEQRFDSKAYSSFNDLLHEFLKHNQVQAAGIRSACIGVAGPVENQQAKVTNLPWHLSGDDLAAELGIANFALINDFQTIGYGIEQLGHEDMVTLQEGQPIQQGVRAVIGAGTGVGHAIMTWCSGAYQVLSSEAGHSSFAPINETQHALYQFLSARTGVVSVEHVLSGPGIENIFEFFCSRDTSQLTDALKSATEQSEITPAVVEFALGKKDPVAVETLDLFIEVYGAAAGNLALFALATGGIYIAGGIAPRIVDSLLQGRFIDAFNNKSKMQSLLRDIPVRVITNPKVGLLGAAVYAVRDKSVFN